MYHFGCPSLPSFGYEQKDLLRRGSFDTESPNLVRFEPKRREDWENTFWMFNKRQIVYVMDVMAYKPPPNGNNDFFFGLLNLLVFLNKTLYTPLFPNRGVRLGWVGVGLMNHKYGHNHGK